MIKAVIFDLDGTLLYTLTDLNNAINFALKENKQPCISIKQTKSYIGNGVKMLVKRALNSQDEKLVEQTYDSFKSYYDVHQNDQTKPYKGIIKLLNELKKMHIKVAIVSNKYQSGAENLSALYFPNLYDVCVGANQWMRLKPFADTTLFALKQLNVKEKECLFVGDSEVDIQTSINANIKCISVLWGYRNKKQLKVLNNHLIKRPLELIKVIKQENDKHE